jgi:ABC-type branched-subunit amino acid transport system substrate-binding protein
MALGGSTRICFVLGLTLVLAASSPVMGQSDNSATKPYATLDRQSVTYRGPMSAMDKSSPGGAAVIGMILPLRGAQEAEGKALLAAAQLALEEEQARGALPDGRKLALVVRDESGPWGQASSEILKLIEQDHALVLLTSANGATAHQAEQMANKISFPILTLASDPSTTETNIPWLFRIGPSDTDQARAIARQISEQPGSRKTLLVVQTDHDGRVGGEEFEKAAWERKLEATERIELSSSAPNLESVAAAIQADAPGAVVVWTDAYIARELLPLVRQIAPSARFYLCSKAAQLGSDGGGENGSAESGAFTVGLFLETGTVDKRKFAKEYGTRTGHRPGIAAFEAYEAVHMIAVGIRANGTNRVMLREYFASTEKARGVPGRITFNPAGNSTGEFSIIRVSDVAGAR